MKINILIEIGLYFNTTTKIIITILLCLFALECAAEHCDTENNTLCHILYLCGFRARGPATLCFLGLDFPDVQKLSHRNGKWVLGLGSWGDDKHDAEPIRVALDLVAFIY